MITVSILKTWYGENAVRRFPLSEDATGVDDSGKPLPDGLLVGMELCVPSHMTTVDSGSGLLTMDVAYYPFISSVIISADEVVVSVSVGTHGTVATVITPAASIGEDGLGHGFALGDVAVDADLQGVGGKVFFGPTAGFLLSGGVYTFSSPSQSGIALDCVHAYPESIRSITIDGHTYTGDIVLIESEDTTISADENGITISSTDEPIEGIDTYEDLLDAIISRFGQPVCRINDIYPDEQGDFGIEAISGGCVTITELDHGISVSNPCATPCCDKTSLETIVANIQALNGKCSRVQAYLEAVTSNLNTLQNELSILKISMK
jgi:hypothetical protein